jgi:hypothetical protein
LREQAAVLAGPTRTLDVYAEALATTPSDSDPTDDS